MFKKLEKHFYKTVFDFEIKTKIHGHDYYIYYEIETDEIMIVKWDEFNEDVECFIDTSKFESFFETRNLEVDEDCWDYATESVYQYSSPIDFDDYIAEYGIDELIEHVNCELKNIGTNKITRSFIQRIERTCYEWKYNFNHYFKKKNITI